MKDKEQSKVDSLVSGKQIEKLTDRIIKFFKEWPELFSNCFKDPAKAIAALAKEGSFERPLTYIITSQATVGLLAAIFSGYHFLFVQYIIVGSLAIIIAAFLLNLILGLFANKPGFYRTLYFCSLFSPLLAIGPFLAGFFSLFTLITQGLVLYLLFFFMIGAAKVKKQQAGIIVAVLALLFLLSFGHRPSLKKRFIDDSAVNIIIDKKLQKKRQNRR